MVHPIGDAVTSTWIFVAILAASLAFGARRRDPDEPLFPRRATEELKGFAILAVFFAHVGYFLVDDSRFLFPLSSAAGVGVDIFLLLAGYGLATSAVATPRSASCFYRRHLPKLYAPMWAALAAIFLTDYFSLGVDRSLGYVARSFLGYFPTANLFSDVNSPLWYFTFIVGCYLLFPLLFSAKRPWISAAAYAVLGHALITVSPSSLSGVIDLYEKHYLAFPLGVALAWLLSPEKPAARRLLALRGATAGTWTAGALLAAAACGTIFLSGVGTDHEQLESLLLASLVTLAFLLKPLRLPLLGAFGTCSYEIYLLHWPIVSRYVPAHSFLPGWLATVVSLSLIFGLARASRKLSATRT